MQLFSPPRNIKNQCNFINDQSSNNIEQRENPCIWISRKWDTLGTNIRSDPVLFKILDFFPHCEYFHMIST